MWQRVGLLRAKQCERLPAANAAVLLHACPDNATHNRGNVVRETETVRCGLYVPLHGCVSVRTLGVRYSLGYPSEILLSSVLCCLRGPGAGMRGRGARGARSCDIAKLQRGLTDTLL